VLTDVQGKEHIGSVACLVTDGGRYHALTNQCVAGSPRNTRDFQFAYYSSRPCWRSA
jgi:hypothetical protein